MKCPNCTDTLLVMSERQGVEIDYCPRCRGVWLDRGELDKLLNRTATQTTAAAPAGPAQRNDEWQGEAAYRSTHHEPYYPGHKRHHKHKSWLSEIFD